MLVRARYGYNTVFTPKEMDLLTASVMSNEDLRIVRTDARGSLEVDLAYFDRKDPEDGLIMSEEEKAELTHLKFRWSPEITVHIEVLKLIGKKFEVSGFVDNISVDLLTGMTDIYQLRQAYSHKEKLSS